MRTRMRTRPYEAEPYIVTGRRPWSPFYGRMLYSGWDAQNAIRMARAIAVSERYRVVSVSKGDSPLLSITRNDGRFGHTFSERWA